MSLFDLIHRIVSNDLGLEHIDSLWKNFFAFRLIFVWQLCQGEPIGCAGEELLSQWSRMIVGRRLFCHWRWDDLQGSRSRCSIVLKQWGPWCRCLVKAQSLHLSSCILLPSTNTQTTFIGKSSPTCMSIFVFDCPLKRYMSIGAVLLADIDLSIGRHWKIADGSFLFILLRLIDWTNARNVLLFNLRDLLLDRSRWSLFQQCQIFFFVVARFFSMFVTNVFVHRLVLLDENVVEKFQEVHLRIHKGQKPCVPILADSSLSRRCSSSRTSLKLRFVYLSVIDHCYVIIHKNICS